MAQLHNAVQFICVRNATDLLLIILHFPPEHTPSAHNNPHSIHTRCQVHWCTPVAPTHTCASEWVSHSSHPLSREWFFFLGLLPRQRSTAQRGHANTSHLPQQISSTSPSRSVDFKKKKNRFCLYLQRHLNHLVCTLFAFSSSGSFCSSMQSSSKTLSPGSRTWSRSWKTVLINQVMLPSSEPSCKDWRYC